MTDPPTTDFLAHLGAALGTRYLIERPIGSGGMAHVYRASDVKHARAVAVKVLKPETATGVGAERFLREIRIAAQLQHPNILPVYDSGDADGVVFYVMPYVEGDTLRSRLRREGVLEPEEALRITREIGDALAFAHGRGIVHRDVKPENVLFSSGHAMVADFGIACALDAAGTERLTQTGFSLGTPDYLSPEQALGERADARSDIYSLSCVLYEMLVGTPPFSGGTVIATLMRKMSEPAPRLSSSGEIAIPAHVEDAIARALSREPDSRYSSVEEFLRALGSGERPSTPVRVGAPRPASTPSIAVLPLANHNADAEDEFLSDGITEELIHALAKLDGLRVVARTSVFAFKGRTEDVRAIGRQLQVDTVLEGSLRRSGSRLRITVQLIDVATGFERWTERYDRALTDVFDVQDEIARSIVDALRLRLLTPEASLVESRTNNVAAYERYLKARYEWNGRTSAGLGRSLTLLKEALELDSGFVPALAALAELHVTRAIYGVAAPNVEIPSARQAAERALARDPRQEGALSARACVLALFDWKWPEAEADFRAAIESNRQMPTPAQWYATNFLVPLGRYSEAREQLARARELDPLSPVVALSEGVTRYYERDFDEAIARLGAIVGVDPRFGMAHYFLGCARREAGDDAAALAHLRDAAGLMGESAEVTAALGVTLARLDERRAREALASLEQRTRDGYVSPVLLAQVYTALGEHQRALDALDGARRVRATDLAWIAVRPVFDPLRGESRFARVLEGMGLSAVPRR
jgi:eukaryotic-like serine/threonine-protein kinase